jgi:hypothetical protein
MDSDERGWDTCHGKSITVKRMISVIETAVDKGNPIYQLKVVLLGSKPPVWRRMQVPGDARLDWLHAALQIAIGWTNSQEHGGMAGPRV